MIRFSSVLLAAALLGGCANDRIADSLPGVYRIDVQQGNVVTQDMVDKLQPGMSRRQVVFTLGSPMLTDPFHDNRWDYFYRMHPGSGDVTQQRLTLYFEDNALARFEGDFRPGMGGDDAPAREETVIDIEPRVIEEPGLLDKFSDWLWPFDPAEL